MATEPKEHPIYQPPNAELTEGELTVDYASMPWALGLAQYATRPWFTLIQMQTMLIDQQVWFGLQLRNSPLIGAKVEVKSPSAEVKQFVQNEWDRFWKRCAPQCVATKYFGYAGFEVLYSDKSGYIEIEGLKDFAPQDVRPLRHPKGRDAGRVAGVGVHGHRRSLTGEATENPTRLFGMKGLWLNFNAQFGNLFGEAATYKCYPAWWDKAMPGGAYDLRRLRAVKDAWIGDVVKYPISKKMIRPDGTEISGKDMMREIAELRQSGGTLWIPSDTDAAGNALFDYQPPQEVADTGVIRNWIEDADWDIFDGLLVPKEVVEAATSGSGFSGRSIPFIMFLNMGDIEFLHYVLAWKQQVAEPQVVRNFGESANDFEMEPVPLLDTVSEKMGGQEMGGPVGGSAEADRRHAGHPDGRPVPEAVSTRRLQALGARRPQQPVQFSVDTESKRVRWITIGAKDGEGGTPILIDADGNIHAGPKALTGKNLSKLDSGKSTSFDPAEFDRDDRPALEPSNRFHQELLRTAEDYELNANDLKETAEWVWNERRVENDQREDAKKYARGRTGLTQQDVDRLSNAGLDHASGHKAGGATGAKLRHFDAVAQELAREMPNLGLGNPDDPEEDFAANLWDVLAEGRLPTRAKHDPKIIGEAAELLLRASSYVPADDVPEQFAIVDAPEETARRRRTTRGIAARGGEIARRLERLLKKN